MIQDLIIFQGGIYCHRSEFSHAVDMGLAVLFAKLNIDKPPSCAGVTRIGLTEITDKVTSVLDIRPQKE